MWKPNRIIASLRRLMRKPEADLSDRERSLRWWLDLARHCTIELRRDRASTMAAALTYHTIFSLLPTLVLSLVVMHSFVGPDEMAEFKEGIVNWILQPVQQDDLIPGIPTPHWKVEGESLRRHENFMEVRKTLGDQVERILTELETVDFRGVGLVGILIFIWAATGLLATVESSFNHIYKAGPGRPPYLRLPIYYSVITLSPLVIFIGQVAQRRMLDNIDALGIGSSLMAILAVVVPLLTIWFVFCFIYVSLPNTRVQWKAALIGSSVAAVLWWVGEQLFSLYVRRTAISTLYGALGLLPLFLLWLWLTWLIVLFGLELAYALQAMREGRFAWRSFFEGELIVIDRTLVLPLATRIAECFKNGQLATVGVLSRSLRLPPSAVLRLLRPLTKAALVHEVREGARSGYTLARPADQISAREVLELSRTAMPLEGAEGSSRPWDVVNELYAELQESVAEVSLEDLSAAQPASGANS
ncbi:MAG TPA: YhjD/YihY/BrkB family envelope integrity protein [Candidatus Krumholzibacteria bacterium]|nr:YhjD/YihY/BrkB family envelope integrity protein [Candidatus Krumholzibacteria bacterium]